MRGCTPSSSSSIILAGVLWLVGALALALATAGCGGNDQPHPGADGPGPTPDGSGDARDGALAPVDGADARADVAADAPAGAADARADAGPRDASAARDRPSPPDGHISPGTAAFCSKDGWCWQNPLPQGLALRDVFAVSEDDVWAVGYEGAMLHFDGVEWRKVDPGVTVRWFETVYGFAWNDVWAAGDGALIHWDGATWTPVTGGPTAEILAIGGLASDDLWACISRTGLMHYGGPAAGWTDTPIDYFAGYTSAVHAFAPDDAWAGGNSGITSHWDGQRWNIVPGAPAEVFSVWGASPDDVWLGSGDGKLAHWDGQAVSVTALPQRWLFDSMWGAGPGDIWATAAWSVSGGETVARLFHLGTAGATTASAWTEVDPGGGGDFDAVHGTATDDVWAVGARGVMQHWDGRAWSPRRSVSNETLQSVWAASASDAWAVDVKGRALRWNGQTWTATQTPDTFLFAVFGTAPDDVWGVGTKIVRFNGQSWSTVRETTGYLFGGAIWGASRNDVWIAGDSGPLYHWTGSSLALDVSGPANVNALWGSAADDIWAIDGGAWHWNGGQWLRVDVGTGPALTAVWGSGRDDVWAVGETGRVSRWRGLGWSAAPSPAPTPPTQVIDDLFAIWGAGPNEIYVAGHSGRIARWNGSAWMAQDSGAGAQFYTNKITGLAGAGNRVFAVGVGGMILSRTR